LKQEELDEQLERDFLTFCGETNVQQPSLQQRHSRITSANIVRVARARNVFMDHQTAEEMIFDADESGTGKLSLDSLIACIETVGADEEYKTV
jgi:Ca2+-binding EF-hand superfamily protein